MCTTNRSLLLTFAFVLCAASLFLHFAAEGLGEAERLSANGLAPGSLDSDEDQFVLGEPRQGTAACAPARLPIISYLGITSRTPGPLLPPPRSI